MNDEKKDAASTIAQVAGVGATGITSPAAWGLGALIYDLLKTSEKKIDQAPKDELAAELRREEARARIAAEMAQAAQEFAIASRIASADEVEIEEFYDTSGEGSLGVKVDKTIAVGGGVAGRKVTRRVIKFKGGALDATAAVTLLKAK